MSSPDLSRNQLIEDLLQESRKIAQRELSLYWDRARAGNELSHIDDCTLSAEISMSHASPGNVKFWISAFLSLDSNENPNSLLDTCGFSPESIHYNWTFMKRQTNRFMTLHEFQVIWQLLTGLGLYKARSRHARYFVDLPDLLDLRRALRHWRVGVHAYSFLPFLELFHAAVIASPSAKGQICSLEDHTWLDQMLSVAKIMPGYKFGLTKVGALPEYFVKSGERADLKYSWAMARWFLHDLTHGKGLRLGPVITNGRWRLKTDSGERKTSERSGLEML
jgi:hypothetical protein